MNGVLASDLHVQVCVTLMLEPVNTVHVGGATVAVF